jgi:hypothetical protein
MENECGCTNVAIAQSWILSPAAARFRQACPDCRFTAGVHECERVKQRSRRIAGYANAPPVGVWSQRSSFTSNGISHALNYVSAWKDGGVAPRLLTAIVCPVRFGMDASVDCASMYDSATSLGAHGCAASESAAPLAGCLYKLLRQGTGGSARACARYANRSGRAKQGRAGCMCQCQRKCGGCVGVGFFCPRRHVTWLTAPGSWLLAPASGRDPLRTPGVAFSRTVDYSYSDSAFPVRIQHLL